MSLVGGRAGYARSLPFAILTQGTACVVCLLLLQFHCSIIKEEGSGNLGGDKPIIIGSKHLIILQKLFSRYSAHAQHHQLDLVQILSVRTQYFDASPVYLMQSKNEEL